MRYCGPQIFYYPQLTWVVWQANEGTWFRNIDFGEQFLNFNLDEKLKAYTGIDVTGIKDCLTKGVLLEPQLKLSERVFLRERTLMGLHSSPYNINQV